MSNALTPLLACGEGASYDGAAALCLFRGRSDLSTLRAASALAAIALLGLAGCKHQSEITAIGGSIGQEITRTRCPAVAVPAETGDVTLFNPANSRDSSAIDIVATLTDLKGQCEDTETSPQLHTVASFRVDARRSSAQGARDVVLPYFAAVVRQGNQVISKSESRVTVHFDDGKLTASTTGRADATVSRAEATLPEAVRDRIGKKRRAKDEDASVDPMSDPMVRAALSKASFELLVGFQLTQDQLAYNATR
jgi:hypothetical protein